MKKIFIVTSGCYSAYGISAAFSTRELAEQFIKDFPRRYSDEHEIEEFPLDPELPQLKGNRKGFFIQAPKDGNDFYVQEEENYQPEFLSGEIYFTMDGKKMNFYCFADDEQHAIKIANEKRGELIAMDLWGKK